MSNFITILDEEIVYIQDLLQSIPFSSDRTTHFLRVYKISHQQLMKLNQQPAKFPVDANKLLKLGISLGNLIKTLQIDEESYQQQHLQQRQLLSNLNNTRSSYGAQGSNGSSLMSSTLSDPFREPLQPPQPKHIMHSKTSPPTNLTSALTSQPPHQVRFIKNLVNILKNFDIGARTIDPGQSTTTLNQTGNSHRDSVASNHSIPHTPQRVLSNGSTSSSTTNVSPIKLNSKQLLIEKLEININLDNLFIYKIILKLILEIFQILKQNLINTTNKLNDPLFSSSKYELDESSSIFSLNSLNSQDSNISNDEYYRILSKILQRISHGIVQPFVYLIYKEFVENKINDDFIQLINSL
ncbi:hypothetical protein Cantr_01914 [Candida viswanathii]|uniref:Uncharacterized protein n=1 Tax=Candida viswanathii TaxID=5486 RepID=A0A367YMK2_9ASCO|nr:hypothetical protein Cantr_01914 [Candida viswanathii]